MARLHLTSATNAGDGVHVEVTLDRAPTGDATFYASRTPPNLRASPPYYGEEVTAEGGPTTWTLVMPPETYVGTGRPARLFYVTAADAGEPPEDRYSCYLTPAGELEGASAVWVAVSDLEDIDDVALQLLQILKDNRRGIEVRLQQVEPGITVKQIVYGLPERIESYPSICVAQATFSEQYQGPDYMRLANVSAELYGYIAHDNPTTQERLVGTFGRAVQRILNQVAYETIELTSGVVLTYCEAPSLTFGDHWNGQRFIANWVCGWQARTALTEP
jgi:hypothetical protein